MYGESQHLLNSIFIKKNFFDNFLHFILSTKEYFVLLSLILGWAKARSHSELEPPAGAKFFSQKLKIMLEGGGGNQLSEKVLIKAINLEVLKSYKQETLQKYYN